MSKVVLFDIDGTLVLTGGAGVRAMNRACEDIAGVPAALERVPVAGRTDWIILHDAMRQVGRELDDELLSVIRSRYVTFLQEEIQHRGKGVKSVLPGVRELLDILSPREDVFLGLVTGNFEEGARIKLEYFDLWRYFRCGAFGDDAQDRNALVPVALRRAKTCGLRNERMDNVFIIGDTPHDVRCALAVGAVPVGVATGSHQTEELLATGARWVFADLTDGERFLTLIDS